MYYNNIQDILPNKLSELLTLALLDLEKIEKDKRYIINMCETHKPKNGKTYVGFGGVVLANTLNCLPSQERNFELLEKSLGGKTACEKLKALDHIRLGFVDSAIVFMKLYNKEKHGNVYDWSEELKKLNSIPYPYQKDPNKFKSDIVNLIDKLKILGY